MLAVAGLCIAALAVVAPAGFIRGLVVGAGGMGALACLAAIVVQATGTAATSMGGAAEQWTAGEPRRLRATGWLVINHVQLKSWDIDHVLIGPGGVFAVETQWAAAGWALRPQNRRLRDAIGQVRGNAHDLRRWHDLKSAGVRDVEPVLFLWGGGGRPGAPPRPDSFLELGGVHVVHGVAAARQWRDLITSRAAAPVLTKAEVEAV